MIILIFGLGWVAAGLAYVTRHRVAVIALLPADATSFFISRLPMAAPGED